MFYATYRYHATAAPRIVTTQDEQDALGTEWHPSPAEAMDYARRAPAEVPCENCGTPRAVDGSCECSVTMTDADILAAAEALRESIVPLPEVNRPFDGEELTATGHPFHHTDLPVASEVTVADTAPVEDPHEVLARILADHAAATK